MGTDTVSSNSVSPEIPEGMNPDAAAQWPSRELIDSFLGSFDLASGDGGLWPGEASSFPGDDPEAAAAARQFRDTLSRFCSGVTVITSVSDGEPVGMTCQSFASVSLHPPMVMFIPAKTSRAWPRMQRAGHFTVNFLAADQQRVSNTFATRDADKFGDTAWTPGVTGAPVLPGVLAHIDCTVHAAYEVGDHYVVIGKVQDLSIDSDEGPLLFYRGAYTTADQRQGLV